MMYSPPTLVSWNWVSLSLSFSLFLTLSHLHSHTLVHTHSLFLSLFLGPSVSLTHSLTHSLSDSVTLSLSLSVCIRRKMYLVDRGGGEIGRDRAAAFATETGGCEPLFLESVPEGGARSSRSLCSCAAATFGGGSVPEFMKKEWESRMIIVLA